MAWKATEMLVPVGWFDFARFRGGAGRKLRESGYLGEHSKLLGSSVAKMTCFGSLSRSRKLTTANLEFGLNFDSTANRSSFPDP
jgi:hypothetical protein